MALPVESIERVFAAVEVLPLRGAPRHVVGAINVHGEVLAVLDPALRLGDAAVTPSVRGSLVIVHLPSRRVAILADSVEGAVYLPRKALTSAESIARGAVVVTGIAAVPDGLVYVFDPPAFLTPEEDAAVDVALGTTTRQ